MSADDKEFKLTVLDEPPFFEMVGPFQVYEVVINGRSIPRLTARPEDEKIAFILDGRFGASFWPKDAEQAAWLIAQALAIGEGYSYIGAENKDRPFAPRIGKLSP